MDIHTYIYIYIYIYRHGHAYTHRDTSPISWNILIASLQWVKTPTPRSVPDMSLNFI